MMLLVVNRWKIYCLVVLTADVEFQSGDRYWMDQFFFFFRDLLIFDSFSASYSHINGHGKSLTGRFV